MLCDSLTLSAVSRAKHRPVQNGRRCAHFCCARRLLEILSSALYAYATYSSSTAAVRCHSESQSLSVFRRVHYRFLSCNKTGFSLTRFLLDQSEMFNIIKFKVTHNIYNEAPIVAGTNAICSSIFKRFFSLSLSRAPWLTPLCVWRKYVCVCVYII